jgi:ABC-type uncharacterized transport system substrate-binding protein
MRRRDFILLVGSVASSPLATRAQHVREPQTIGFLGPLSSSAMSPWTTAFVERLRELGWIEGLTVQIEYRWADGRNDRLQEMMNEFIRQNVRVIVTGGTAAALAAKRATSEIPIVFATAGDPVGTGLVTSLARPGGNVTGLSVQSAELPGKRLQLLREIIPTLRRIAIMGNVGNAIGILEMTEAQAAARALGLQVITIELRRAEDIRLAFDGLKDRADGLYVVTDPLANSNRVGINTLALSTRLPTIHGAREYVEAGGLVSYGPNFADMYRRAGDYVDKILHGEKPSDLPVQQPISFDLVVNLTTAKVLGLNLPPSLLALADEMIR